MSWPFFTRSPSLTGSWTILPMTSALTLTCVLGSILPGARTRAVMSSSRTRANCTGVIFELRPRTTPTTTRPRVTTTPRPIHSHLVFMRGRLHEASVVPAAHAPDSGLGHPHRGACPHQLILCALQLHL